MYPTIPKRVHTCGVISTVCSMCPGMGLRNRPPVSSYIGRRENEYLTVIICACMYI